MMGKPVINKILWLESDETEFSHYTVNYSEVPGFSGCPPAMDSEGNILWCAEKEHIPLLMKEVAAAFKLSGSEPFFPYLIEFLPHAFEILKGKMENANHLLNFLYFVYDCLVALRDVGKLPEGANPEALRDMANGLHEVCLEEYLAQANMTVGMAWDLFFGALGVVFANSRLIDPESNAIPFPPMDKATENAGNN